MFHRIELTLPVLRLYGEITLAQSNSLPKSVSEIGKVSKVTNKLLEGDEGLSAVCVELHSMHTYKPRLAGFRRYMPDLHGTTHDRHEIWKAILRRMRHRIVSQQAAILEGCTDLQGRCASE